MPAYFLTRDAFSLLVMGFTGAAAIQWKLKYIEAFNALESAVMEKRASSLVEAAREAGYMQGRDEALGLPAMEKERKAAYLKGMAEGKRLQIKRDGLNLLARILNYQAKGLTQGETARILGISQQRVSDLLARARKLGLVPNRPPRPFGGGSMSAMREVPVDVVDEMDRMEARVAFLSDVFLAISERPENDVALSRRGLEGLFYWTQDLEDMLRRLNEMIHSE